MRIPMISDLAQVPQLWRDHNAMTAEMASAHDALCRIAGRDRRTASAYTVWAAENLRRVAEAGALVRDYATMRQEQTLDLQRHTAYLVAATTQLATHPFSEEESIAGSAPLFSVLRRELADILPASFERDNARLVDLVYGALQGLPLPQPPGIFAAHLYAACYPREQHDATTLNFRLQDLDNPLWRPTNRLEAVYRLGVLDGHITALNKRDPFHSPEALQLELLYVQKSLEKVFDHLAARSVMQRRIARATPLAPYAASVFSRLQPVA